ncbi:MAG: NAD-dependent DNA ligase LigA [Promethearchaeota archaeon]
MTKEREDVDKRIEYLVNEIQRHRYLYYNETPEISDAKYDALEYELRQLDPENPILYKVGVDHSELFTKREHIIPMTSQDKVTTPEEFSKWAKKHDFSIYIIQFKLDGISIEVQYEKGIFRYALTRGDGKIGDDVSYNVANMKGFIPKIQDAFTGAVRGEIMLYHDVFDKKYSDKQNCRNAAAGIVRRKDGIGTNDLNLIYYDAISLSENVKFKNEPNKISWLKNQGFPTVKTKTVKTTKEVIGVWENVMNNVRDTLNYDIDGLVIKGPEIDLDDVKRVKPMKQIAFKFQAEEIETALIDVVWSKSGHNYTPVAIVEPVTLMGTTVSRASLANPNLIEDLGLKIGSEVMISKRGDIIPKIERVIRTPEYAIKIEIPNKCEVCGTSLINEGTRLYCPNEDCPKRSYRRLVKWIRKLGVKHFSEKLMLRPLFNAGKVKTIADLYKLKVTDLTRFEGVQEKSAKKALHNLFAIKEIPLATFIAGFNIENIGEELPQRLVDAGFNSLEKIRTATVYQLSQVDGFADITARTLLEGVKKLYPEMQAVLNISKVKIKKVRSNKNTQLEGLSFCITGGLETFENRDEARRFIKDHGGMVKTSVTKGLSYLVTNSTEPTAKFLKAQELAVKIITENDLREMIENRRN